MPQILIFEIRLSTKNDEVELFKQMTDDSLDIRKTDFGCKRNDSVEILDTNDSEEVWRIIWFSHSLYELNFYSVLVIIPSAENNMMNNILRSFLLRNF